jgi:hypothetical protein
MWASQDWATAKVITTALRTALCGANLGRTVTAQEAAQQELIAAALVVASCNMMTLIMIWWQNQARMLSSSMGQDNEFLAGMSPSPSLLSPLDTHAFPSCRIPADADTVSDRPLLWLNSNIQHLLLLLLLRQPGYWSQLPVPLIHTLTLSLQSINTALYPLMCGQRRHLGLPTLLNVATCGIPVSMVVSDFLSGSVLGSAGEAEQHNTLSSSSSSSSHADLCGSSSSMQPGISSTASMEAKHKPRGKQGRRGARRERIKPEVLMTGQEHQCLEHQITGAVQGIEWRGLLVAALSVAHRASRLHSELTAPSQYQPGK